MQISTLTGGFVSSPQNNYDVNDQMMVDLANGSVVDLTATLTFSSAAEHSALLESLSDAADLFMTRLPHDDDLDAPVSSSSSSNNNNQAADLLQEAIQQQQQQQSHSVGSPQSTESLAGSVETSVNPFPEHGASTPLPYPRPYSTPSTQYKQAPSSGPSHSSSHPPGPNSNAFMGHDSYHSLQKASSSSEPQMQQLQVQVHLQNQNHNSSSNNNGSLLSPGLSFDLDSPTTMSLPSPSSCGVEDNGLGDTSLSPPGSVASGRRDSTHNDHDMGVLPSLQVRVNVIQQRVS